ncbi:MAG TPA: hypothetical protein VFJ05_00380 [Nitrososphaeraceae archaeon]|nr:hypothetical protein [Nitrososphaeraceae archaeon]
MAVKDLKKRINSSGSQQQTQSFDILKNKPFWNIVIIPIGFLISQILLIRRN